VRLKVPWAQLGNYLITYSLGLNGLDKVRHDKHGIVFIRWNRVVAGVKNPKIRPVVERKSAAHVFIHYIAQAFDFGRYGACCRVGRLVSSIIDNVDSLQQQTIICQALRYEFQTSESIPNHISHDDQLHEPVYYGYQFVVDRGGSDCRVTKNFLLHYGKKSIFLAWML
jgi:hypothetical protein